LAEGAVLKPAAFTTLAEAKTFFDTYMTGKGVLDIGTAPTGTTPEGLIAGITGVTATKGLKAKASSAAAGPGLVIPPGYDITTADADTLATVATVTVEGSLTSAAATFASVTTLTVNGKLTATAATFGATNGTISIGDGAALIVGLGATLAFDSNAKIDSTGSGYILAADTAALPKIVAKADTTKTLTVRAEDGVNITADMTIGAGVTVVITGETEIKASATGVTVDGAGSIVVLNGSTKDGVLTVTGTNASGTASGFDATVEVPVIVQTRGTLTVTGGNGDGTDAYKGGTAIVEKVDAKYGSKINVTAGAGGASQAGSAGGDATIGATDDAKKIAFTATWATTNVTMTGGAAGGSSGGDGGNAILYTSNPIKTDTYAATEGAVIDHVTITAKVGAADAPDGSVVIDKDNAKSITVEGASNT
jgi:hypothetical protein